MKATIAVIIAALLVLGGWWYFINQPADEIADDAAMESMEGDSMTDDHDAMSGDSMSSDDGSGVSVDTSVSITDEPDVVVNITGENFSFSREEIRVSEGDIVQINFSSTQGTHDWTIDEFDAQTETVTSGNSSSVTFVADETGTFEYYCSIGSHRQLGMVGTLIVE